MPEPIDLRDPYRSASYNEAYSDPTSGRWTSWVIRMMRTIFLIGAFGTIALPLFLWFISRAPEQAPRALIDIPEGTGSMEVANMLSDRGVVRSSIALVALLRAMDADRSILSGAYLFDEPETLLHVARRLAASERGIATHKVTFPEGIDIRKMAEIVSSELSGVPREDFLRAAAGHEGELFPDTYFWFGTATTGEVITEMIANGITKTSLLRDEAAKQKRSWGDVVILASILEREVQTSEDRRVVAGILLRRMEIGMALQVDATFAYMLGKTSDELTLDDLKSDSPYNTYTNRGLPPGPIGNPGLDTLDAALHPIKTPYLYYLSDKEGITRFAKTFEEHKLNKQRYLR